MKKLACMLVLLCFTVFIGNYANADPPEQRIENLIMADDNLDVVMTADIEITADYSFTMIIFEANAITNVNPFYTPEVVFIGYENTNICELLMPNAIYKIFTDNNNYYWKTFSIGYNS